MGVVFVTDPPGSGQAFEAETEDRLKALGWNTTPTAVKGDWGADVIARIGGETLVVQCKDWGSPVGLSAVQEIAFARTHYQAQIAAVVSRNGYTRAAKGAAKTTGVYLFGLDDLRVGTSVLDRSEEGARLREDERRRQARGTEFELERQAAVAWRYFDEAIARRRFVPLFKKLLVATIIGPTVRLIRSVCSMTDRISGIMAAIAMRLTG
jgi:hypothetical protein